ncbi:hypothetical protein SB771_35720, partial [Burkholderia sp. SIMBA_051]
WYPVAPPAPRKGRGAVTNLQGRYEVDQREAYDDGWQHVESPADARERSDEAGAQIDEQANAQANAQAGERETPEPALRTQIYEE